MGEYAYRLSDDARIKVGTCEEMYYLRLEDIDKIRKAEDSLDVAEYQHELRFRLPFPLEDNLRPGDYRGERTTQLLETYKGPKNEPTRGCCKEKGEHQGPFHLLGVRPTREWGVRPIVDCGGCRGMWNVDWESIWLAIDDSDAPGLQDRLRKYLHVELNRKIEEAKAKLAAKVVGQ